MRIWITSILFAVCALGFAQSPGNSHLPRSPYLATRSVPDAVIIQGLLDQAAGETKLSFQRGSPQPLLIQGPTVVRLTPKEATKYLIDCDLESHRHVTLPVMALRKLSIVKIDKAHKRIMMSVTAFPAISTDEILKHQYIYSELVKGFYLNQAKAWFPLATTLKGSDGTRISFTSLKVGMRIAISGPTGDAALWWALPSVTDDPAYPFRINEADPVSWPD